MRAPASGGATEEELPDMLIGSAEHDMSFALEAKRVGEGRAYITREETAALVQFAVDFGAFPVVSGRWDGDTTHYITPVDPAPRTKSGNISLSHDNCAAGDAVPHTDLPDIVEHFLPFGTCPSCGGESKPPFDAPTAVAHRLGYTSLCERCASSKREKWDVG